MLDALRGFALLGIFISHIPDFSGQGVLSGPDLALLDLFGLDDAAATAQDFLIRGKFYALFSLLFGIGFALQMESAARRGADFARHFVRRLTVLLAIGLVHASLWYGDILKDYALIGFVLLLARRWSLRTLAWATALAFAARLVWPLIVAALFAMIGSTASDGNPGDSFALSAAAFAGPDLAKALLANLALVKLKALQMVYDGKAISVLSMFLLGAVVGRLGLYRNLSDHGRTFALLFWICAPVGVIGNGILTPLHAATPDFPPTGPWILEGCLFAVAVPAMAIAYASGFAWLWSRGGAKFLAWLAPAGRMALTTYVSQTLIGITLFYGLGLGLAGQVGRVEGMLLAIGIFALQCAMASLWLRRFQFGPIEWLWRRLTYGVPIPLRRKTLA
ncbi:DUF418 domain-containing protein [Caulobacter henricii]|uniref:DUF418 domain-containing protein n=1 Tax=Caulobacter henricii TaxID=69395 RepID=UPI001411CBD9|nr:DUF418 domain-containing protein [Caulobacter henricii]